MISLFKKLKDKKGSIKEILTDNLLLLVVIVLIGAIAVPSFVEDVNLLNTMRRNQIEHNRKIEIN